MASYAEPSSPLVAVVIVAWNRREDVLACLNSVAELDWQPLTTVIVDNASEDGTAAAVAERFPTVSLLVNETNLGYAGGLNVGLRRALDLGAEYVLPLNSDTTVHPDAIQALVREAQHRPDAGSLCPMIYYAAPADMIWYAGAFYNPNKGYNGRQVGYRERDRGQYTEVSRVTHAAGTAMLIPRAVLERVGFLDGDLFVYAEDLDWSVRVRAAGYGLYVVPQAKVWHRVSPTTGGEYSDTVTYYVVRNTLEVQDRYAAAGGLTALRRRFVFLAVWVAQARRARHPLRNLRAVSEGWRDYRRRRFGARDRTEPHRNTRTR
jgi:GT2 family glycosyltransferase